MNTAKNFIAHVLSSMDVQEIVDCSEPVDGVIMDDFKEVYSKLSKIDKYLLRTRISRQILAQRNSLKVETQKRVDCLRLLYGMMSAK